VVVVMVVAVIVVVIEVVVIVGSNNKSCSHSCVGGEGVGRKGAMARTVSKLRARIIVPTILVVIVGITHKGVR